MAETRTKIYHGRQAEQRDEADAAAHGWRVVSRESAPEGYRVTYEFGSGWTNASLPTRRRRGLRKATWLAIMWSVAFALLWLATVPWARAADDGIYGQAALTIGIGFIWFIGFLVTGLIWFMSRPRA